MNYLFIVTESVSANGICARAVMEVLARNHGVWCLTAREPGMESRFCENGVNYVTVRSRLTRRIRAVASRREGSSWQKNLLGAAAYGLERLELLVSLGRWPLLSPRFARDLEAAAEDLCRREDIGCLVPVYTQIDALIAAHGVKERHRDILYIPWFLDSLSGGYGLRIFSPARTRRMGLAWERKLLDTAEHILVMESSRTHHDTYSAGEGYYGRLRYVDLPLLRTRIPEPGEPLMDPASRNLVYVGTLPAGIRSPEYLLEVFRHLDGRYHLWFIGDDNCDLVRTAARREPRIHVLGRRDHGTALRYEAQAHILVNIGSRNPNMTPSKIFEYLSFGKPILSTVVSDRDPCRGYLQQYPLALILDECEDTARAAARVAEFAHRTAGVRADPDLARQLFRRNTPEELVSFLDSLDRRCVCENSAHQFP